MDKNLAYIVPILAKGVAVDKNIINIGGVELVQIVLKNVVNIVLEG